MLSTTFYTPLFWLSTLLIVGLSACQEETPPANYMDLSRKAPSRKELLKLQVSEDVQMQKLFAAYEEHLEEYDSSIYFKQWTYDPEKNNITCADVEKEAILQAFNHKLGLGFDDYIAKENKKTLRYKAVSPFAHLGEHGVYKPKKPLRLNGKLFSGVLIGTHIQTGKRILEARFYQGVRVGEFKVWTNLGRLYKQSYGRNNVIIINEAAVRKPVIYLYPTQEQEITVQLDFQGEIIHSYPAYPQATGWKVKASPDGTLRDVQTGKEYGYLFWEGQSAYQYQAATGFVVEGKATVEFLEEKLEILGLNRAEATDFITYWMPELEKNPYNLIHFSEADYQTQAPLIISPSPTTLLRVFMVYQPLTHPIVIPKQDLPTKKRQGFTVVEWGGKKEVNLWPL